MSSESRHFSQHLVLLAGAAGLTFAAVRSLIRRARRRGARGADEAASPEALNPNPVIETDADGAVCYLNPAAAALFPDLERRGSGHPFLRGLPGLAAGLQDRGGPCVVREVSVADRVYEQHILRVPGTTRVRLYATDVTLYRQAREARRQSEENFARVFRAAPTAISISRLSDGRFIDVNDGFVRLLGYPDREAIVGRTASELGMWVHGNERARVLALASLKESAVHRMDASVWRRDGTTRDVIMSLEVMEFGGEACLLSTMLDITERKIAEQKLTEAKNAAEEMARLKSAFVANMSHEIRTPLTAIMGFANVLEEELNEEKRGLVGIIRQSGERLLETLNSVLELARLEANAVEVDLKPLDLQEELQSAARLFEPMAHKKGLAFSMEAPRHAVQARLDRACLHRVLTNLLSNAVKFTDEGEVRLVLVPAGDEVRIDVVDTGIGLDEAFLPHLFEEFKQESTGLARTHTGSGLGLAITRRLVECMHGRIMVRSIKGKGSTFTVLFPAMTAKPTAAPETSYRPSRVGVMPRRRGD